MGMVVHTRNASTWEAEEGDGGQPGLHIEIMSSKKKNPQKQNSRAHLAELQEWRSVQQ
jgi:hypothetical protein